MKKTDIDGFLSSQRLAIKCARDIAKDLRPGVQEKKVAKLMDAYLQDHGVRTFFHKSFAWFGNRTGFHGFKNYFDFLPSKCELKDGDVIILDTAPIYNGYPADIGYTFSLQSNEALDQSIGLLKEFKEKIPKMFESQMTTKEIWDSVDKDLRSRGFENAHSKYPFSVLGHKLHYTPLYKLPGLTIPFSLHAYASILGRGLLPELLGPKLNVYKEGLWAIEPHLGFTPKDGSEAFGAKFEEMLVVENGKAHWLETGDSGLLSGVWK